jgi:hypothetical protein
MPEFKDKIPAAGGNVEFLYDPQRGIASRISGSGFRAIYQVALSLDGKHLLATVPATGYGVSAVYPQPSVLAFVQSDQQGMWGRNCPICKKYFRTNHIMGPTSCPYCSELAPDLAFVSEEQKHYLTACYDAFARAYLEKKNTSVDMVDITDEKVAWHYSEEKLQFHFTCQSNGCKTEADILGEYGYCPACGRSNSRHLFPQAFDNELARLQQILNNVSDRHEREETWEKMTVDSVSRFEALAKHLRRRLLRFPMTANRRKELEALNFQQPLIADRLLKQWFDVGMLDWGGNGSNPKRQVPQSEIEFIKTMVQKRHILIHNGGLVDQEYLDNTGDVARLDERIRIRSKDARRFLTNVREMGMNLLDSIEESFTEV